MPVIDKPLSELKTYRGINPRPSDFDAYWRTALKELDATDPDPKFVPTKAISPRGAEAYDLWFTGVGGARIHAKYLRPLRTPKKQNAPAPAILQFHGYSGNAGDWADKLSWVSQDFHLASLDCRGQGGSSEDKGGVQGNTLRGHIIRGLDDPDPQKLLFRSIFLDTAQMARVILALPDVDAKRVGATGGSQGGALTLACAALEPRVRRAASVFPFLCDYRRVWEMDLAKDAYQELRDYFRLFDPRHEREDEIFTKLGYIDCQNLAPRIKAETLMFTGLMDTICPPSTQFAAYNKIKAKKRMVIYPDFGHEGLPGHFDTIFNFLGEL
ncbi:acetylxylan esterase [Opitutaceae bacterium TAV4]|uniref:acetylxylan esterase n=1 Tax=Geminisphaera colitermitum TaxID=1148786 RepID=UPI000158D936|nr:acetylxylan esterase [Geminisphaera colitermitum]RRJ95404.1 acetylxylan esterase [Opitutaceae bacterium TAV4]RRJ99948.1 acetylxylan esterase [Opitutaceae bacterium TAV3]